MNRTSPSTSLAPDLQNALHNDRVPKFLATQDAAGRPNIVPIISLDAADARTLVFAELFIWKTRNNLAADPRVGVTVITEDLHAWTLRGRFRHFVDGGPYVQHMNRKEMFRYNAYVGVSRVGIIDVEEVSTIHAFSKLRIAAGFLKAKALGRWTASQTRHPLPHRVAEKFARSNAVKAIAFRNGNGFPHAIPLFSLVPSPSGHLVFSPEAMAGPLANLALSTPIAASVITMDPIAYQIKGTYEGCRSTPLGRLGRISCQDVYSASPPLPGERIPWPPSDSTP